MAVALLLLTLWALRLSEGIRTGFLETREDPTPFLDNRRSARSSPRETNLLSGCEAMPCATYDEGTAVPIPGIVSIRTQIHLQMWNPKLLIVDGDGNEIACIDMKANPKRILLNQRKTCIESPQGTVHIPHIFYGVNEWLHFNISLKDEETFIAMYEPHTSRYLFRIPVLGQRVQVTECRRFGYSPQFPSIEQTTDNDFPINTNVSSNKATISSRSDEILKESEGFVSTTRDPTTEG
ncbi:uncharacterized protein LOC119592529 [Penaeus monodon]|uniref:uncharacterized protein LOC119592529 n=1 Tax=Penaeus monodon TaxID=6687 RepID=UPI0018A74D7D|nr:uncharacterized protein LOC119592529 [Penaeus monodon]